MVSCIINLDNSLNYQAKKIAILEYQKEELIRLARSICSDSSKLEDISNMSDSINDAKKDEEFRRLQTLDIPDQVKTIKELYPMYKNYLRIKQDLTKLGFKIEEDITSIKVWKEY